MKLKDVLCGISYTGNVNVDADIADIAYNSAAARENTVFTALCGAQFDGHKYCADAYSRGCRVFAVQYIPEGLGADAEFMVCEDTRAALSRMSANFFRHPDREVKVIGITGTNGKTTQTFLLSRAFEKAGAKAGVIGTNGAVYGDLKIPTSNTTPESYETHKILRAMADAGCEYVFTEVSSLGIKQHRTDDIEYHIAIFTNFSPDHVGGPEHATVEEYLGCKLKLFSQCRNAVLNCDDAEFERFKSVCSCKVYSFGTSSKADYRAENITPLNKNGVFGVSGVLKTERESREFAVSMPGAFSAYNALTVFCVCDICGVDKNKAAASLTEVSVEGRLEHLKIPNGADVFIDYAHNGDAVENILKMLKEYEHNKIVAVIGCVGGRAQIRRAGVGTAAGRYSDFTVVSSDDPGFESPEEIGEEVAGYVREAGGECIVVPDRREAVAAAVKAAHEGDFLVLLGKGHETAQKIKGQKVHYSDREEIEKYIAAANDKAEGAMI